MPPKQHSEIPVLGEKAKMKVRVKKGDKAKSKAPSTNNEHEITESLPDAQLENSEMRDPHEGTII